jgi:hypothetical protein
MRRSCPKSWLSSTAAAFCFVSSLLAASARSLVNDVVALEDGARLLSADPPGHALLNAEPPKVADTTPSQIVEQ